MDASASEGAGESGGGVVSTDTEGAVDCSGGDVDGRLPADQDKGVGGVSGGCDGRIGASVLEGSSVSERDGGGSGMLACGYEGVGRLAPVEEMVARVQAMLKA
jgi:hypothetical protein